MPKKEQKKRSSLVIDKKTGEITHEIADEDIFKITRKNSRDYLNRTTEILKNERFAKVPFIASELLAKEKLSTGEMSICLEMFRYIRYDTGCLCYSNGRKLTLEHIKRECNYLSGTTVQRSLESLVERRIFAKVKAGNKNMYLVNPYVFSIGRRINKTLQKVFEDSKWAKAYISEEREKDNGICNK